MESGLTTGDLALMAKENNNGWCGDGGAFMWIFALLILAGGGSLSFDYIITLLATNVKYFLFFFKK